MRAKPHAVYRCDLLPHGMNAGKEAKVRSLLRAWRAVACQMAAEQWRLFFESGALNARNHASSTGMGRLGTSHRQMVRSQVVGVLGSWLANRQNEFKRAVETSTLDTDTRHQLHVVNRLKAWHRRGPITMKNGTEIPTAVRALARSIFRGVCARHRRPTFGRLNLMIDQRMIALSKATTATEFSLWARLSTLNKGSPIWVPLRTYPIVDAREGQRALAVQINETPKGLQFGLITDVGEAMLTSRASYQPKTEAIALDLGLRTLFATSEGDLLGRDWMDRLRKIDAKLTKLAVHRQRTGTRKVKSPRYARYVEQLRGLIRSEVGRILNRLVATRAPATLVVEHLRFRSPGLSRRMNRLLSWFGKSAIEQKLASLTETYGIAVEVVSAAYSSQECSCCSYPDKSNRPVQASFACRWCGHTAHADVNGARVLRRRRSAPDFSDQRRPRQAILESLVRQHVQRFTRLRAQPADPRRTNPYFKVWFSAVTSTDTSARTSHPLSTAFAG